MNDSSRNYYLSEFALGEGGYAPHKHIIWQDELTTSAHLCNASYPICMVEQDVQFKYIIIPNSLVQLPNSISGQKISQKKSSK